MMKQALAVMLVACTLLWCTKDTSTHDIPNLSEVDPGIWRSGQPQSPVAWAYLKSIGIHTVIKLNYESEGSDQGAIDQDMTVIAIPMPPRNDVAGLVSRPEARDVAKAIAYMTGGGDVLVHCTHGQDRTGLVVGVYRVVHDHDTKARARREMLQHGFHPELLGLDDFWEDFNGTLPPPSP